jgi:hypothetical protein
MHVRTDTFVVNMFVAAAAALDTRGCGSGKNILGAGGAGHSASRTLLEHDPKQLFKSCPFAFIFLKNC